MALAPLALLPKSTTAVVTMTIKMISATIRRVIHPIAAQVKAHQPAGAKIGFQANLAEANTAYPPSPQHGFVGRISPWQRDDRQRQKPQPPDLFEELPTCAVKSRREIAIMQVAHLVAFQRALAPRQRQAERQQREQGPQTGAPGIGPARARHPKPHAAPHRPRRPIAPRAENRELPESVKNQNQGNAGKRFSPLGLDADQEIDQIDRRQDGERKQ